MTAAASLHEVIPGTGSTQTLYVGPNSKLIGALLGSDSGSPSASVEVHFLGTWIRVSDLVTSANTLFDFDAGPGTIPLLGQLAAGTAVRVTLTGTGVNNNVMLMTS